jgi:hypothetical protein
VIWEPIWPRREARWRWRIRDGSGTLGIILPPLEFCLQSGWDGGSKDGSPFRAASWNRVGPDRVEVGGEAKGPHFVDSSRSLDSLPRILAIADQRI